MLAMSANLTCLYLKFESVCSSKINEHPTKDYGLEYISFQQIWQLFSSGGTLVRGFQCSPKVDLNANFFVSIIRNQELGCLLRGGVAGCITGLLLRDAESFNGLPDPWMIIDRKNEFPFQSLKDQSCPKQDSHRRGAEKAEKSIFIWR
jgi:hypothetical protein